MVEEQKLGLGEFIDRHPLSRYFEFNVAVQGVGEDYNSLWSWLVKSWMKRWPTVSGIKTLNLPSFNVRKSFQKIREIGRLEWICH